MLPLRECQFLGAGGSEGGFVKFRRIGCASCICKGFQIVILMHTLYVMRLENH